MVLVGHKRAMTITVLDVAILREWLGVTETALAFIPYMREAC